MSDDSDVEIRLFNDLRSNKDNQLLIDEIVAQNVTFHIEQMNDGCFWFALYKGEQEWRFWMHAKSTKDGVIIEMVEEQ